MNSLQTTKRLLEAIERFDTKGKTNEYWKEIKGTVENAVEANKPLNLISFTCSTINSEYLFSDTPWLYVSNDPKGNNLESDISRLVEIMREFSTIYPPTKLTIIIGNTDPYYIYLQQFKNIDPTKREATLMKFAERWETYKRNFVAWVSEFTGTLNVDVLSWYEFEKQIESEKSISFEREYEKAVRNIDVYFSPEQRTWEFRKLQTQFGPGKYFEKLARPDIAILTDWIVRKFAQYAVQGKWIVENIPDTLLIQNEKPSDLRSQMYQPLINEAYKNNLPVAYFFGVDNGGYQ